MTNQNVEFETPQSSSSVSNVEDLENGKSYDLNDFAPEAEVVPAAEEESDETESLDEEVVDDETYEQSDDYLEQEEREYPYEVPRPALTIDEASSILGKSIRSIERSIQGRWGNKLPEGWQARKMKIDGESEWRIIPPPGFRIRHTSSLWGDTKNNTEEEESTSYDAQDVKEVASEESTALSYEEPKDDETENGTGLKLPGFGFSLENFFTTAGNRAKTEIARAGMAGMGSSNSELEHPTIVIDRSDDVERLLRELANTQKELSEERRLHMQDMKLIAELQGSMRLLEDHASQTSIMKKELVEAQEALIQHKKQYEAYLALPWWRKLFKKAP